MRSANKLAAISKILVGTALFLGAAGHSATAAEAADGLAEPGVLKVGIIPAEDARAVVRQSKEVMDQISKALNMKTEIFVGSDYNATIEALRSNKVDVALMGAFGYVLATTQAPVEAFAVTVTAKSNSPDYHSIIIARADAGDLTSLEFAQGPHLRLCRSKLDLRFADAEGSDDGQSHRPGKRPEEGDLFRRP